jgi:ABC-type transport system involved in Fe-S cluster assembly fused permease/ATPase subunit
MLWWRRALLGVVRVMLLDEETSATISHALHAIQTTIDKSKVASERSMRAQR